MLYTVIVEYYSKYFFTNVFIIDTLYFASRIS